MIFLQKKWLVVLFCLIVVSLNTTLVCAAVMQNEGEPSVEITALKTEGEIPEYLVQTQYALDKGQFEFVLAMSQNILSLQPGNISAQALLAAAYTGIGNQKSAQKIIDQIQKSDPGDLGLYIFQAKAYRVIGKPVEAEKIYKRGLKSSTGKTEITMLLADLYGEQKKFKDAAKLFEQVLEQKVVTPKDYLNASFALCRIDLELQKYDRVVRRAKEIIASYPPVPQGYMFLATAFLKKEKPENAVAAYKKLIRVNPNIAEPYQALALIYVEQFGDRGRALRFAEKASSLFPDDAKSKDVLGWVLYRSKKFQKATEQFKLAVEISAGQAIYYYHLGLAELQMKKNESARKNFVEALSRISKKKSPTFAAELKKRIKECGSN